MNKYIDYFYFKNTKKYQMNKLKSWVNSFNDEFVEHFFIKGEKLFVKTIVGISFRVNINDVILRGVKGDYSPCTVDAFEETYNKLD